MKKWIFLFLCLILCGVGGQAFALSLFDVTDPINGIDYTIVDRHRLDTDPILDVWYDSHDGYKADVDNAFSGYYIGTITQINGKSANENESPEGQAHLLNLINYFLDNTCEIISYDKVDASSTTSTLEEPFLTVDYDLDEKSGSWATTGTTPLEVNFYIVKSGPEFALYYLDPAKDRGTWITDHLGDGEVKEISHLSVVVTDCPDPVPEPATMMLFGTGLIGMSGLVRRKRKK